MMANWTKEKLSEHSNDEIESLRNNAIRLHKPDIVDLCNEELASRAPVRKNKVSGDIREDHTGQYVAEFHFVCPNELGVMRNSDGTIWTGTWVVDEDHAKAAVKTQLICCSTFVKSRTFLLARHRKRLAEARSRASIHR
jgi:hypothetical protein